MFQNYFFYVKVNDNHFSSITHSFRSLTITIMFIMNFCFLSSSLAGPKEDSTSATKWVGTWSTAPQLVETANNPPSPGLSNNTIRQVVHISIGGDTLRMRFTNEFSTHPVTMHSVHIALSKGNGVIDTTTDTIIYFNSNPEVTMAAGSAVMSDPFKFSVAPLSDVAITIYFGSTSKDISGHPGSRTTSYILTGDHAADATFTGAVTTAHWYVINTIEVMAPDTANALSILGDSITDGRGSDTDKQDRWPDELSLRFQANDQTNEIAVLNEGIGGNCVLAGGLGPTAISRFNRDVLNQHGVKWLIILEGINDIGGAGGTTASTSVAPRLINAFGQFIDSAHARNILVYGATLTPFGGSSYDSPDHQKAGQILNDWIRHSGRFDGVVDFDSAMHDPNDTTRYLPIYDSGDHLHPSPLGHHMMAEAVNLSLFGATTPVTAVKEKPANLPNRFSLSQNYPNPFNPSTVIQYTIPKSVYVTLKIYDALGKEIAVLVNENKAAGEYNISFIGSNLASGIYFYRIIAGSFMDTKKLILLK